MNTVHAQARLPPPDGVVPRAQKLRSGPLPYIDVFINALPDLWSPNNRAGWVPLVVAENKLAGDIVLEKMHQVTEFPAWVMNYGGMKGSPQLQAAMAALLNRTFVKEPQLDPNSLCILAGCSAVVDSLFYCIADTNDGVLIPAPYYPAFDNDLKAKNAVVPLPFYLDEAEDIAAQLDAAAATAETAGNPIRALLITNPNNPLGIIYKEDTVKAMMLWCLSHKVHYVSDEIYALSVFDPELHKFTSALTLVDGMVKEGVVEQATVDTYVHLLYGLSKDWCASGLRVGLLYSKNEPLQEALNSLCPFASISNYTQHTLAEILADVDWTDSFTAQNTALLGESYAALTSKLDEAGIPYLPAVAGMFAWVDLRAWLPEATWAGEAALWKKVCDDAKVILTPGESCHAAKPGYFRLCFAWVPKEALEDAVGRLKALLTA